jgi:hypothetical protein
MDNTKKPEGTRLSRELLQKQGSLVRVVGLQPVFKDTATVRTIVSKDPEKSGAPGNVGEVALKSAASD